MATKEDLQAQLGELQSQLDATYTQLSEGIAKESVEIKTAIATLEAKILQLQNEPNIPVDFSVDLSALKASVSRFDGLADSIAELVIAPGAELSSNEII